MPADTPVKLRGTHASTLSSQQTGLQSNPVLDVRLVENTLGNALGQDAAAPLVTAPGALRTGVHSFVSAELTLATTAGTKEMLTIWHPNTVSSELMLLDLRWQPTGTPVTAGRAYWEFQFISAENGTPGGTSITAAQLNRGNSLSGSVAIRQGVTGAPTTTGPIFERRPLIHFPQPASSGDVPGEMDSRLWDYRVQGAIVMRASTSEGLRVTLFVASALTGAQTGFLSGTLFAV
jgi:hypothetical protein